MLRAQGPRAHHMRTSLHLIGPTRIPQKFLWLLRAGPMGSQAPLGPSALHACLPTRPHACLPTRPHACLPACLHACMPTRLPAYTPTRLCARMPTCLHAYMLCLLCMPAWPWPPGPYGPTRAHEPSKFTGDPCRTDELKRGTHIRRPGPLSPQHRIYRP